MTRLADLHRAVQTTLTSKRLGQPVFVRYTVQGLDKSEPILPRLAQVTAIVQQWLGQPLDRIYALGTLAMRQVSLALQFRSGGTALVSFAYGPPRGGGVDIVVLGDHGAIYHDAGSAVLWDDAAVPPADRPDPIILAAIEQAMRPGKREPVTIGAKP